jgi:lysophospholipase L1-like esterase
MKIKSTQLAAGQFALKHIFLSFLVGLCILLAVSHSSMAATLNVAANDAQLQYRGRVNFATPTSPIFYWAGSEVAIAFQGTDLSATLVSATTGYMTVIIDNSGPSIITVSSQSNSYTLAGGLSDGAHTIRLIRNNDHQVSSHTLNGFVIAGASPAVLALPATPARRIEFYGDSITTGMGALNPNADSLMVNEDNYYAYGAVTARTFDADYTCVSRSGIGIVKGYGTETMPQVYHRLDPLNPNSLWNFSLWTPDVVVVDLGQNDYWLIARPKQMTMVNAYKNFFSALRQKYPNALIIGTLGCMNAVSPGSPFPGYVTSAVAAMNDPKIISHIFAYTATAHHPSIAQQQGMANELAPIITQKLGWTVAPDPNAIPTGTYNIINNYTGKALRPYQDGLADDVNIVQYTYDNTSAGQQWQITDLGNGYYSIINVHTGKALRPFNASLASLANIVQFVYDSTWQSEQWQLIPNGAYYGIRNRYSNLWRFAQPPPEWGTMCKSCRNPTTCHGAV